MGKIYDALERHKKEKSIKVEFLTDIKPQKSISKENEIAFAREVCTTHDCSPKVVVLSAPDSVDAEDFRILRTQILFSRDHEAPRSIMVTSALPGEGKTFVALNLATSLALGVKEHVLLVDCDLRRPQVHKMLGYNTSEGLYEHLTGKKPIQDLVLRTQIDGLSVLPAGKVPRNPREVMSSTTMEVFLGELRRDYKDKFIVIDSAPSQAMAEAQLLARHVDGIILVVMALKSPREAIKKAVRDLGKEKILGIVFNGYNHGRKSYHKYYEKYYKSR